LTLADVRNAADIERAITPFAQQPNGGMIVVPNAVTVLHRDLIIGLAAQFAQLSYPLSGELPAECLIS
jgi:putative tryptophan/tyrosine transport system substrate-binding protein